MTDTLRERIALALYIREHYPVRDADCRDAWLAYGPHDSIRLRYLDRADAVLAVLRGPSEEDVERAARAAYSHGDPELAADFPGLGFVTDEYMHDTRAALTAYVGGDEA